MFLSKLFNRSRVAKPPLIGPLDRALRELRGGGLRPRFELRAVKPNETRPGLAGRRLGTFDTFEEAFEAFKATKARPGRRLEVSMTMILATRWSPVTERGIAVATDSFSQADGALGPNWTPLPAQALIIPPMPSVEQVYENAKRHLNSPGILNGAVEPIEEDIQRATGFTDKAMHDTGLRADHLCDSDGKLVDVGKGRYVHTCSTCGEAQS